MDEVIAIETSDTTKALVVVIAATAVVTVAVVKGVQKIRERRQAKKETVVLIEAV
jgi:ABC-type nitrate/sulfonate/bicarbonate transport system permease component